MADKIPGDPAPIGPIAGKKRDILVSKVGTAIGQFAMIESQLLLLFAQCLGLPNEVAAGMLAPVRNFATALSIINVIVQHRMEPLGGLPYWRSLHEYIAELSRDRNYLAHTAIAFHTSVSGIPRDEDLEPKIGPAISDYFRQDDRNSPIDSARGSRTHPRYHVREQAPLRTASGARANIVRKILSTNLSSSPTAKYASGSKSPKRAAPAAFISAVTR